MTPENEPIINRVSRSTLQIIDLEEYFPTERIISMDIAQWLDMGVILREKAFREALSNHRWEQYQNALVHMFCSTDAIIPSWAYVLVASHLNLWAKKVVKGDLEDLLTHFYTEQLQHIDFKHVEGKPTLIKGCSKHKIPESVYVELLTKIQPLASRIMFGEACSAVPIYKNKM